MPVRDRIERIEVLPVARARVWDAITKPEQLSQWMEMIKEVDLRVGGDIHFNGTPHVGRIEALEPPERFAFSWPAYNIGHPELNLPPAMTRVEFTLEEVVEGTRLAVVESGFASLPPAIPAEQLYQENTGGWPEVLAALQTYLQSQVSAM